MGDGAVGLTMYSQLLLSALADETLVDQPAELLARLLGSRRRLLSASEEKLEVGGDMAANLAYDVALLLFCKSRGIDCDPRQYAHVLVERRRLEAKLAEIGIDVATLIPN